MSLRSDPYRCMESPDVPCDVLEGEHVAELPDHVCGAIAHRLTRRFATLAAPIPPSANRSGRIRWSRRSAPEDPLDRIIWLRWRWWREWPLPPDGGALADQARELGIDWELVVPPLLPSWPIGIAVVQTVAGGTTVTLLGQVQSEVGESGACACPSTSS